MVGAKHHGAAPATRVAEITHDTDWLSLTWSDGLESRFPAIWLRDNLPEGRQGPDGQKLFDIAELPPDITLSAAGLTDDGRVELRFAPEGVTARLDPAWLRAHDLGEEARAARRRAPRLWGRELAERLPAHAHAAVSRDPAALRLWLADLRDLGFALLQGVPLEPGEVCRVVGLFGYVRETNYGRLFDVITLEAPDNLAFTGLGLGLHTDNPYREPVPGLQLLHCLEAGAEGGESLVRDGFAAAEQLRREAPEDFDLLTRWPVPFRYVDAGVDLRSAAPLIETDGAGRVTAVRYNNRSVAPFDLPAELLPGFYRAYRRFGRLLHAPEGLAGFRLRPGDLFIVDNRRVLHGRRGFSGRRRLQGCYADRDALLSRLRKLELEA